MAGLADRILDAVVARLKALSLPGVGGRVYREKVPDGHEARQFPAVVVSYFQEFEDHRGGDAQADVIGYPVLVAVYDATLREHDAAAEGRELGWRGSIDDALRFQRLGGVAEVTTCLPEPRAIVEAALADAPELQRSSGLYRFVARRGRG